MIFEHTFLPLSALIARDERVFMYRNLVVQQNIGV
jgi:hypothetical protein